MELLSQVMYTSILFFVLSFGAIKIFDFDDFPFWLASSIIIVFFVSIITIVLSILIIIWI